VEKNYGQFGLFRFNQHSIMVLKACQQRGACHTGSEQLDMSRLTVKQPSQPNESSPGCSDHLRSAKKVNKGFLILAVIFITLCLLLLHNRARSMKHRLRLLEVFVMTGCLMLQSCQ
jgi:hypothetical protein